MKRTKAHARKSARVSAREQQTRANARSRRNSLFILCVLYCAIAISGVFVAGGSLEMRLMVRTLSEVEAQRDELLAEHSQLLLERGAFSSYQNIDRVAAEQLGMKFPDQVERVEL